MLVMPGGVERGVEVSENKKVGPFSRTGSSPVNKPGLKFLIYGKTEWIGGLLGKICEKQGIEYEYGMARLENRAQVVFDIKNVKPTHVFNAAGVTGRPNVDWCVSQTRDDSYECLGNVKLSGCLSGKRDLDDELCHWVHIRIRR